MRSWGGEPVVTWRSEAPFSTIAFRSWCRFATGQPFDLPLSTRSVGRGAGGWGLELVRRGVPDRLGEAGHAGLHLGERGHAQGAEPEADRLLLQLGGGAALDDELLQPVPERHDLVHGDAALVAAVVAGLAAAGRERLEGA